MNLLSIKLKLNSRGVNGRIALYPGMRASYISCIIKGIDKNVTILTT
jgi:hypothetical protein